MVDTVFRGFHVYKVVWNPVIGETLICKPEFGNIHDPFAVDVCKGVEIVGQVCRRISPLCYFFLKSEGTI